MRETGKKTLWLHLRTLVFYGLSAILFFVCWPFAYASTPTTIKASKFYLRGKALILKYVCGITIVIEGKENLPSAPYLVASLHESTWETLYFHEVFDWPAMYAKKEIFGYPFFGRLARKFGHIPVDRSNSGDTVRDGFRKGEDVVRNGRSLLVFPTGTRGNAQSSKLQTGIGVLYQLCDTNLVPVKVSSGRCWPAGDYLKYPGQITVRILPPIPPRLHRRELMRRLEVELDLSDEQKAV